MRLFSLFTALLLFTINAHSQIELGESSKHELSSEDILGFHDASGSLSWTEALNMEKEFKKGVIKPFHKGGSGTYWILLKVKNGSNDRWLLEHQDPNIDHLTVFVLDKERNLIKKEEMGEGLPFDERKIRHINLTCDLPFEKGSQGILLIRVSSHLNFQYLFQFVKQEKFINYALSEYFFLGLFYGVVLIMILYNLLIYFSVNNKLYLYYVFYVMLSGLYTCGHELLNQYLWPGLPGISEHIWALANIPLVIGFFLYARKFLSIANRNLKVTRVLLLVIGVQILLEHFVFRTTFYNYTIVLPFLTMLFRGWQRIQEGYKPAIYFFAGTSAIVIGMIIQILMGEGFLPANIYTVYSLNLAIVIELAIFSRALGSRIRFISKQKEESDKEAIHQLEVNQQLQNEMNTKLEHLVKERTNELQVANEEIRKLNALLSADNERLKINMAEVQKARLLHEEIDFEEFTKTYPDNESCFAFLANLKWTEGYECQKCGNEKYFEGRTVHARRCSKCGFDETPQLFTLLSNVKFSIVKAFYIIYFYHTTEEKITSTELSKILYMRQKTVWSFLNKIKQRTEERAASGLENTKWYDALLDGDYKLKK